MDYGSRKAVENSPCGRFIKYNKKLFGGSYKDVYLGFDRVENIEVAWNQIDFEGEVDVEEREILLKLYTEAHMLKSLKHESIIMCFSRLFDSEAKTLSMITELFPSISLKELRRTKSKCDGIVSCIDLAAIKNWGRQILEGLNFLHSQNPKIVHRNINCDNIFVHSGGKQVKLGGFGLAIRLIEGNFEKELLKGNSAFMAPEYYDEKYNELVDIYAFGMCLLEIVTGEYPYRECSNELQVFRKASTGVKPASVAKVKDSRVKDIIDECLLPMSLRPSARALLKDPFFLYDGGSTLEACTSTASSVISRPFPRLHCCAN